MAAAAEPPVAVVPAGHGDTSSGRIRADRRLARNQHTQPKPHSQSPPPPLASSLPPPNNTPPPHPLSTGITYHPMAMAVIPPNIQCTFVGEGSANAVFCFTYPPAVNADPATDSASQHTSAEDRDGPLSTHLLRVPKAAPGVGPHTCIDHHVFYASVLQPLLGPEHLVGQLLVSGVSGVRDTLNGLLADLNGGNGNRRRRTGLLGHLYHNIRQQQRQRRPDWTNSHVAEDVDIALLVENMAQLPAHIAATLGVRSTTIEFKPKWLAQSPTAPAHARRCRTCAMSAAMASKQGGKKHAGRSPKPCPLILVAATKKRKNSHSSSRSNASRRTAGSNQQHSDDLDDALWTYLCQHLNASSPLSQADLAPARTDILHFLRTNDLFQRLAAIQREHDPVGAMALSVPSESSDQASQHATTTTTSSTLLNSTLDNLQTAMTLRDCTCFLRITIMEDGSTGITAKLGDLDRKDGPRKIAQWQATECDLINGGFYTATEEPQQETQCWLGRV